MISGIIAHRVPEALVAWLQALYVFTSFGTFLTLGMWLSGGPRNPKEKMPAREALLRSSALVVGIVGIYAVLYWIANSMHYYFFFDQPILADWLFAGSALYYGYTRCFGMWDRAKTREPDAPWYDFAPVVKWLNGAGAEMAETLKRARRSEDGYDRDYVNNVNKRR